MTDSKDRLREIGVDPEEWCSCYYCISHFPAKDITCWTGDKSPMAICPNCMIDSVLRGYVVNSELEELYERYFNTYVGDEDFDINCVQAPKS